MARFELRLSEEDRVRWRQAAAREGLPLSIFIRRCVEDWINQREGKAGGISPPDDRIPDGDFPLAPAEFEHHVETGDQPRITRTLKPSQLELEAEEQDRKKEPERPDPFKKG